MSDRTSSGTLAGPRRQPDRAAQQRRRLSMAHTVQVARDDLELTSERQRFLTLTVEQGALAIDELAELMEIPVPAALRHAYELKQVSWIGTEELLPGGYPWAWVRQPGARRIGLTLRGGRPDPAEVPYMWAANAARLHFSEEFLDARWVSKGALERDYRATRVPDIPAGVVEIDDAEGFIQRHAVEVRWAKAGADSEPDLDYLEDLLAEHVERYEAVDYFCPENVYRVVSEVGFEELYETLTIHGLGEPARPVPGNDELLSQLARQALPSVGGNRKGGMKEGSRRAVRVREPIVVYEIELSELPQEALQAIAIDVGLAEPKARRAWKKDGGGNHVYCVETDVGVFHVGFSGWGWRADAVVDEGVFEKRGPKPPPAPRKIVSRGEQEISDELWARIEPMFPRQDHPKARKYPYRTALAGILCLLRNEMRSWKDLTLDLGFGSGSRCLRRLRHWEEIGLWDRVEPILRRELDDGEELDWSRLKLSKGQKLPRV